MGFILGLAIGALIGAVLVIVFGKKNEKTLGPVRETIIGAYEAIKDKLDGDDDAHEAINKIKK